MWYSLADTGAQRSTQADTAADMRRTYITLLDFFVAAEESHSLNSCGGRGGYTPSLNALMCGIALEMQKNDISTY
jgi:hypothetical protein